MKTGHIILLIAFVVIMAFFTLIPTGRGMINTYEKTLKKVDDVTTYEQLQKVENTARAMISNYEADILVYNQYKDSEITEQLNWAGAAKMRANKTASIYNNYILENSFIWKNNVPKDIKSDLPYIE
jgi:hypothetical protein